jgi:hypothetical protein
LKTKKVIANLPLKFTGAAAGVKAGGKLVLKMKSIKVKTLPKHLKESIEVDVSNLELNENIRVQDIKADNMEVLNPPRISVASVVLTRQLKQEEAQHQQLLQPQHLLLQQRQKHRQKRRKRNNFSNYFICPVRFVWGFLLIEGSGVVQVQKPYLQNTPDK